ncbi:MAG TPA: nucleotidyltransferase family protein [Holophaga sp.]|nr:nucleotidyltransferase family protein [Holophaga sp.]
MSVATPGEDLLRPPDRILVLLCRLRLERAAAEELGRLLGEGPDWGGLLEDAAAFGILPLFHHHLGSPGLRDLVPEAAWRRIKAGYTVESLRSMRIFSVLGSVRRGLAQAGVPFLLLKGAHLAPWLYGDAALRPMGDLDLLVRRRDRETVVEVLRSLGFSYDPETFFNGRADAELAEQVGHLAPFILESFCRLEIHETLLEDDVGQPEAFLDGLWERSLPLGEGGAALALEDEVLFLAAHLHRHVRLDGTARLCWFCDLHELLLRFASTLDWEEIAARARATGKWKPLGEVLGWLEIHWGSPVPAKLVRRPGVGLARILETGRGLRGNPQAPIAKVRLGYRIAQVRHLRGWGSRLRYLVTLVLPGPDRMRRLHAPGSPLGWAFWYCFHPFWKAGRYLRGKASGVRWGR